jgi:hypothetical protein
MSENMPIYSVTDEKFKKYARVIKNYDCTELVEKMQETPLTNEVEFVASVESLESLPIFQDLREREFGGMPIQLGYCNGDNHKLNAVEYHRTSEVLIAATDLIVILGSRQDVDTEKFTYDTSLMEAFLIPSGTMIELFATTLHYAPCSTSNPFRCAIALPKGTGTALKQAILPFDEDALLLAVNKWVIGHPESDIKASGGFEGLIGKNLSV